MEGNDEQVPRTVPRGRAGGAGAVNPVAWITRACYNGGRDVARGACDERPRTAACGCETAAADAARTQRFAADNATLARGVRLGTQVHPPSGFQGSGACRIRWR